MLANAAAIETVGTRSVNAEPTMKEVWRRIFVVLPGAARRRLMRKREMRSDWRLGAYSQSGAM